MLLPLIAGLGCLGIDLLAGGLPLSFETRTIDESVGEVCYALEAADVNGDGRIDLVAATDRAVHWYAAPDWRRQPIVAGRTAPDNVCLAAADLDLDGRIELFVGAGWGPLGLRGTEELVWIGRQAGSEEWLIRRLGGVPSLHRIRCGRIGRDEQPLILAIPLQGPGVAEPNWGDGPGVQIRAYGRGAPPHAGDREFEVADEGLHTAHGATIADLDADGINELLVAAWEGVFAIRRDREGRWSREKLGSGYQGPGPSKGASEVRLGRLADGSPYLATVEPWHGDQLVIYSPPARREGPWDRHVIDDEATGAHGLWCVDLDGDGDDEVALARRDADHDLSTKPNAMGVFVYDPAGVDGAPSRRTVVDDGGIAAEDLVAADLDGDGRTDLAAGGRETHNVRIYLNRSGQR